MHKTRGPEERYIKMRKIEKRIERKKKAYFEEQMKQVKNYMDPKKAEERTVPVGK